MLTPKSDNIKKAAVPCNANHSPAVEVPQKAKNIGISNSLIITSPNCPVRVVSKPALSLLTVSDVCGIYLIPVLKV